MKLNPVVNNMKLKELGNTGIKVSSICFGTLAVSSLQQKYIPKKIANLFGRAYELGINFFDTAEIYDNYLSLALALRKHPDLVIASRSYAATGAEMRQSVERARRELQRDYLDIFGLHEVESDATLRGHQGALEYLREAKMNGIIRAIAISTHTIAGVRAAASHPGIDVIHPLINHRGIGIKDGGVAEMVAAIRTAKDFGKGIYAMKILAGGHLGAEAVQSFKFINGLQEIIDAIAVGMQSPAEIKLNRLLIMEQPVPRKMINKVNGRKRSLQIAPWCQGCGRCVQECNFGALRLEGGKIVVEQAKCLRCGYCARVCPDFCLKII